MFAAVFSERFSPSPRSPLYGLWCISALGIPHQARGTSYFFILFWCLSLETAGEVCILHKKTLYFCLFCLLIFLSFRVIIRYQKRTVLIMEQTKTKPLLQCSAKYIVGICYDGEGLSNFVKDNNSLVLEYAYILHDSDVKEDGTLKEPHYHFLFVLNRSRRLADIQSCLKKTLHGNVMLQSCHSVSASYCYLTHENEDSKVHYDECSIVSSADSSFWKAETLANDRDKSFDTVLSAYLDLLNSMPVSECAKKYGRDFIIHYTHIKYLLLDSGMILDKGVYFQRGDFVNYNDDFMYRYKNSLDEDENVSSEINTDKESE